MAKSAVAASGFHGLFPRVKESGKDSPINREAGFPERGDPEAGSERLEREEPGGEEAGFEQSARRKNRPKRHLADVVQQKN